MSRTSPLPAAALAAAAAAPMMGTVWPGMSMGLAQAFSQIVNGGKLSGDSAYVARRHIFYHRQSYGSTGASSFAFFNAPKSKYITNINNGILDNETAFLAKYLRVTLEPNITFSTGAPAVAAAAYVGHATKVAVNIEEQLRILNAGQVLFTLNGRIIVDVYGLRHFASGSGANLAAAAATTTTTTNIQVGHVNNGVPVDTNGFKFEGTGLVIPPGKPIAGQIDFQSALPLTDGGAIIMELEGILVTPANA